MDRCAAWWPSGRSSIPRFNYYLLLQFAQTSATIRVIRGELHALSPSPTPHPPQGHRLGDATRMTRRRRITADRLRVCGSPPERLQHRALADSHYHPEFGRAGWGSATIRVIRGELHALSPSLTPHPPQGHLLGDATRLTRRRRIATDRLRVCGSPPERLQHGALADSHYHPEFGESWVGIAMLRVRRPPHPARRRADQDSHGWPGSDSAGWRTSRRLFRSQRLQRIHP